MESRDGTQRFHIQEHAGRAMVMVSRRDRMFGRIMRVKVMGQKVFLSILDSYVLDFSHLELFCFFFNSSTRTRRVQSHLPTPVLCVLFTYARYLLHHPPLRSPFPRMVGGCIRAN